ncbi:ANTAR domain-containing protein [Streptomyces sp. NPDC050147]|uniref:ANTAR domain-containing protein n=1 Tax=Streptomyces sp. NPDC050147 TaxID=3155513 RepID=UPI003412E89F
MTEPALSTQLAEEMAIADDLVCVSDDLVSMPDDLMAASDADVEQDPRAELVQLRRAMETRPAIDMARGVLMASFGLAPEDAWSVLVSVSQNTNTKLHVVADELVGAVTGGQIPKPFRRQLAATIARVQETPAAVGLDKV